MLQMARLPEAKLKPIFDAPSGGCSPGSSRKPEAWSNGSRPMGVLADDEKDWGKAVPGIVPANPFFPAVPKRNAVKAR